MMISSTWQGPPPMEEQLSPMAITHLLQYTLRSLCDHDNSPWMYAVFWRILPRNYPPPKWDLHGSAYDRTRGNRRNWILVWEDGFCNFSAAASEQPMIGSCSDGSGSSAPFRHDMESHHIKGLQPELFFKMSHEIYNYGEGLIGKVAADHSHKWVHKEPQDQEISFLSAWHNPADSQPRTWEGQFQSGIKTIALIAVREGVVQLGAMSKVLEDLSYVVLLRKKFSYLESIPGVLLPHPSSSALPATPEIWPAGVHGGAVASPMEYYDHLSHQVMVTPSMSSLEALLSKLPPVCPAPSAGYSTMPMSMPNPGVVAKEGTEKEEELGVECGSSMASYYVNVSNPGEGF